MKIVITIDETGAMHVEAHGFKGQTCERELKKLLNGSGLRIRNGGHKPEFFQASNVRIRQ